MPGVALVTGGGRGVGSLVAETLARQGRPVAVTSRTQQELDETVAAVRATGGRAAAYPADARSTAAASAVVKAVENDLGPVEILVSSAGSAAAVGPAWEVDADTWWLDVETNLRSAFNYARAVLPGMIARGAGRIVNVSSYAGTRPGPYMSAYAAAKAALVNFSESLAAETAGTGVKVFAVTPGLFRSALTEGLLSESSRRWLPNVGSGRWVEPAQVAALVDFVASGRGDALAGRFLHALDDLEKLAANAGAIVERDLLTLRLRRWNADQ
jgi:3-oxoacyl-[acyl-carrier protein] reductase